jgi:hypothetical protein
MQDLTIQAEKQAKNRSIENDLTETFRVIIMRVNANASIKTALRGNAAPDDRRQVAMTYARTVLDQVNSTGLRVLSQCGTSGVRGPSNWGGLPKAVTG